MATQNSVNNSLGTTAYAVICGGTTATGAVQPVASVGTSGQVLTSNGAGALPTFQTASSGGGLVFIESKTASSSSSLDFTSIGSYNSYKLIWRGYVAGTATAKLTLVYSTDGGSSWLTTGYDGGGIPFSPISGWLSHISSSTAVVLTDATGATGPGGGSVEIQGMNSSQYFSTQVQSEYWSGSANLMFVGFCVKGTTNGNALRVIMTSGNISAGVFDLYGYDS